MLHSKVKASEAILSAALEGLELQKQRIAEQIAAVRSMLASSSPGTGKAAGAGGSRPKRTLSAQARKKISIAQRRRWANFRRANPAK